LTVLRRLLFAAFAVAALIAALPLHAAPIGGTLTGAVVMKTAGVALPGTPMTVTLLNFNGGLFRSSDETADARTTMTAPDGTFTFSGLDTTAAGVYRVIVNYKGVAYEPPEQTVTDASGTAVQSRGVRFANNATTATVQIPIYEPVVSDNAANFTITSDQIIMNEVRPQFYSVLEALQITNSGDRTLVGALNADGSVAQGVPIVFTAPANAQTITTNRTDLLPTADLTGQKLTLRTPIQPGGSDLAATYDLPGSASGLTFQRTLDYAATQVQVLVSDARQAIASTTLHNDGPIQAPLGATPFRKFSLANAQAGQQIDLTIGPSPAATPPAATPTTQKSGFARLRDKATVPVLLVLAGLCLVLMLLILRAPQRRPNDKVSSDASNDPLAAPDDAAVVLTPSGSEKAEDEATVTDAQQPPHSRPARGRPHDYDLDAADREIEAANTDGRPTKDGWDRAEKP
ncbi:MAG: hypothetical protein LC793_19320, partial [Thermomicrobia bacterium]|nr:hypothetical protein [Thermomicrobia bacterium]